jgi:DNA-binding NtrC family response regulator
MENPLCPRSNVMNTKPTLLIVDDEPDLLELLSDEAIGQQFQVETAKNGKEALERLTRPSANRIDAVLSDINMPLLNGLELLSEVRKAGLETPFVFLTGYGDKEKAVLALRLGAMDFLDKPFDRKHLHHAMRRALEYGVLLQKLEQELDALCEAAQLPPEKLEQFRAAQRAILLLKKSNQADIQRAS